MHCAARPAAQAPTGSGRRDAPARPIAGSRAGAAAPAARAGSPRARSDDDRDASTTGSRVRILDRRGRRPLRRDPARPRARARASSAWSRTRRARGSRPPSRYRPSAILLDINLPDHSGLGVLDQLKRNPRTRHIPVHVVSVADYAQRGAGARRGRLRAQAGQARGARRGVPAARSEARAGPAPRPGRRGRRAAAREHHAAARRRRTSRSSASERAAEALDAAAGDDLRLHGDGPEPARPQRLRAARADGRAGRACRSRR